MESNAIRPCINFKLETISRISAITDKSTASDGHSRGPEWRSKIRIDFQRVNYPISTNPSNCATRKPHEAAIELLHWHITHPGSTTVQQN